MVINLRGLEKYESKHIGSRTNVRSNKNGQMDGRTEILLGIMRSNVRTCGVTELLALMTRFIDDTCSHRDILGMKSCIGTGDMGIF